MSEFDFTQGAAKEALDKAVAAAVAESEKGLKAKNTELMDEITYQNLNKLLAKFGDRQSAVIMWAMAGAGVNSLVGDMLGGAQFNDSGVSIYNGGAPTLGKPA